MLAAPTRLRNPATTFGQAASVMKLSKADRLAGAAALIALAAAAWLG